MRTYDLNQFKIPFEAKDDPQARSVASAVKLLLDSLSADDVVMIAKSLPEVERNPLKLATLFGKIKLKRKV